MKLNFQNYKDKVKACWIGKNIGGTMGYPYEGLRQTNDIKGFATKPGEGLPNDDLDLQLVWLLALETIGPMAINAQNLGEFWLSYITPHWNEYGLAKINMKRGLVPPLSGDYENHWKNSNGAWIRTEIWACVAPGSPAVAAKYALEDGKVDHGSGEGTYAAAFVASMQSAAFVLSDIRKCVEIGLASIPASCRMGQSIVHLLKCYDKGMTAMETRNSILALNADIGDGWFEAPSNVSYAVIGLLYGGGDFKKSMITAINCGDDTDCTAATVGATLGIMYGMEGIPKDWSEYIGDDIITISIARGGHGRQLPSTCTQLTERVVKLAPHVLYYNRSMLDIEITEKEETLIPENIIEQMLKSAELTRRVTEELVPYTMTYESLLFRASITLDRAPHITGEGEIGVQVEVTNLCIDNEPYNISLRWILPEGFTVLGGKQALLLDEYSIHLGEGNSPKVQTNVIIKAGEKVSVINRVVLEIIAEGRVTSMYIPITLLG